MITKAEIVDRVQFWEIMSHPAAYRLSQLSLAIGTTIYLTLDPPTVDDAARAVEKIRRML